MAIRTKIITNFTFPKGSINPELLIGQTIEVRTLGSDTNFVVDSIEYETEYPGVINVGCIHTGTNPSVLGKLLR